MSQSLVKKFLGTAGIQVLGRGLMIVLGIVLARLLGPEEFGRYSFLMSLIALFVLPTIAGMPQLLIREVANAQLEKRWGELKGILHWAMAYIVVTSFIVMLLLAIAIKSQFIRPDIGNLLWIALLLIPLRGLLSRQNAILNGLRFPVLAQLPQGVLTSIFSLIIIGFLLVIGESLNAHVLIKVQIFSSLFGLFISAIVIRFKVPNEVYNWNANYNIKTWHKTLLPFTLLALISTMNMELASVVLGFLANEESVAYFKVAMQGVTLLSLGLAAINTIVAPQIARSYKQCNFIETQNIISNSVKLSTLTSIPFALGLIFLNDWIITIVFGEEYLPASPIITILCIGQIVNVLMGSVGIVLQMTNCERESLKVSIITLLLSVFLLFVLVPPLESIGAAIAVTISVIFSNCYSAYKVYSITSLKTWLIVR